MRIGSLAAARPAYYDRNALSLMVIGTASAVGPHGFTTRVSQTCPAGTKYVLEYAHRTIERNTAATTSSWIYIINRVVDATATNAVNIFASGALYPTVGGISEDHMATAVTIYPAEVLAVLTRDDSTGGTVSYNVTNKLTSFTA